MSRTAPAVPRPEIREHEDEPVPGLPEALPPGETLLWQGAPEWRDLARRAFHVGGVALYFGALSALAAGLALSDGAGAGGALAAAAPTLLAGFLACSLLAVLARLSARAALYTLTDRRLVLRVGVALPTTVNLPFAAVASAGARLRGEGPGDIVLTLAPPNRASWIALWPHLRPWRTSRPEPMLRSLPDAPRVAALLARALAAEAGQAAPSAVPAEAPERAPAGALAA